MKGLSLNVINFSLLLATQVSIPLHATDECVGGTAGDYPCSNINLLAFLPASSMIGSETELLSE